MDRVEFSRRFRWTGDPRQYNEVRLDFPNEFFSYFAEDSLSFLPVPYQFPHEFTNVVVHSRFNLSHGTANFDKLGSGGSSRVRWTSKYGIHE